MLTEKTKIQGLYYEDGKYELYEEERKKGYSSTLEAAKAFFERYYAFSLKTEFSEVEAKNLGFEPNSGLELGCNIIKVGVDKYTYTTPNIGSYATAGGPIGGSVKITIDPNAETQIHTHPGNNQPNASLPSSGGSGDIRKNDKKSYLISSSGNITEFFNAGYTKYMMNNFNVILGDAMNNTEKELPNVKLNGVEIDLYGLKINQFIKLAKTYDGSILFDLDKSTLTQAGVSVAVGKAALDVLGNNIALGYQAIYKDYEFKNNFVKYYDNNITNVTGYNYTFVAQRYIHDPSMPSANNCPEIEPIILPVNLSNYEDNNFSNIIIGNSAENKIKGNDGNDMIFGGMGKDMLIGGEGNDILYGGEGEITPDKILNGTFHQAKLEYKLGDSDISGDILVGEGGNDKLYGNKGEDYLDGGDNDDYLDGGEGNDILYGGKGSDILVDSQGDDTYVFINGDSKSTDTNLDTIIDSEGLGKLKINNKIIEGKFYADGKKINEFLDNKNGIRFIYDEKTKDLNVVYNGAKDEFIIKEFDITKKYLGLEFIYDSDGDGNSDLAEGRIFKPLNVAYAAPALPGEPLPEDAGTEEPDFDKDGLANWMDDDDDNDGILTIDEMADPNGDYNPDDAVATEGKPDYLDGNDTMEGAGQLIGGKWDDILTATGVAMLEFTVNYKETEANSGEIVKKIWN